MNFLSLFSGIGGMDIGLELAGMQCAGQVEKEPYCIGVLEKHWPAVKRVKDIYDVRGDEFGTVDLVCGGFPCQPFSLAGKRKGKKDDRYLWPEMLRVIKAIRPAWVLGENVAGIIGVELDKVLSDLEGVGYSVAPPFIIPACAVDAPHRRDRVWIVAHASDAGVEGVRERENGILAHAERMWWRESPGYFETARQSLCSPEREESTPWPGSGSEALAHADSAGLPIGGVLGGIRQRQMESPKGENSCGDNQNVPDTERIDGHVAGYGAGQVLGFGPAAPEVFGSETVPDARCGGGEREGNGERERSQQTWRFPECGLGGMADGVSRWLDEPPEVPRITKGQKNRVARLRALGNAVVPQVVYQIGRAIMEADS